MLNVWIDIENNIKKINPKNVYVIMDNRAVYIVDSLKNREVYMVSSNRRLYEPVCVCSDDYIIYYVDNVIAYGKANDTNVMNVLEHRRKELGMDSKGREWNIVVKNNMGPLK